jgi:hypothetical protein
MSTATLKGRLDERKFGSILVMNFWLLFAGPFLLMVAVPWQFPWERTVSDTTFLGLPLFHLGDTMSTGIVAHGVVACGVISVGVLSVGVISFGGGIGVISFGGVGIVSFGGVSIGVVAVGGASLGVIAIGGAALGYIAIGGGAMGIYVLAGGGKGRYVFDRRRQNKKAVDFFVRYVPRLRQAFAA